MNKEKWLDIAEKLYKTQLLKNYYYQQEKDLRKELTVLSSFTSQEYENFKFEKIVRKGSINYNKIEILTGINLEVYRKPSTNSWKLTNVKEKIRVLNSFLERNPNEQIKRTSKDANLYNPTGITQATENNSILQEHSNDSFGN